VKKVDAVIRLSSLGETLDALDRLDVAGLTVSEVLQFGEERAVRVAYRGAARAIGGFPKVRLEVLVADAAAGPIAHAIARAARTGRAGDGIVWISGVEGAIRIRTGERGAAALIAGDHTANGDAMPAPAAVEPTIGDAPGWIGGLRTAVAGAIVWIHDRRVRARQLGR